MIRPPRSAAFTLIEMITVIAIIAILASLVLAVNGLVQKKSALARAESEIRALGGALESYKTDNGGYPQDDKLTDTLDPRKDPVGAMDTSRTGRVAQSSQFLYVALTGDTNLNGMMTKNYAGTDFFKPTRLGGWKDGGKVLYIQDPFGGPYGYSTAGLKAEQDYRQTLATNPSAPRPSTQSGFNPTYDLWTIAGDTPTGGGNMNKWIKNW